MNDEQAEDFASLLHFMILLHWKTGFRTLKSFDFIFFPLQITLVSM